MTQHELKILPEYFVAVRDGIKKFEVRKDDRPFEVGDILCLHEINCGVLTGRTIKAEVTYVLRHPDYCKEGYCILSIKVAQQELVIENISEKSKREYHELVITGEGTTDFYVCPKCKGAFATDLCQINGSFEIDAGESFKFCPYCGKELGGVEHET
ncbi:MAG: DUF3850 domain-containing protein [Ruminococcus sp.]|uniref:ASCH/PUA domain-containing protein n=1 Tax=Ruminococcus sp. TaxID=41978 RepID=UPI0025F649B8|nr:ASCH/PUA domain-containing protein [Ruminococcus sp.]MBR6995322.1 DUF3850 domain-containing protein [Ruminococcus sp.]